jgi:hypothetical protein
LDIQKIKKSIFSFKEPQIEPDFVLAWDEPNEIEPYMDALTRWRNFRRTFYIAIAQGEARQVIESIVPPAGLNGAKFIETMFTSQEYVGYTPENQMLTFYNALKAKGEDPIAALIAPRTNKYDLITDKEIRIISGTTDFKTNTGSAKYFPY